MLEVALHNPRQHKQIRRQAGSLVLACSSRDSALWTTIDPSADPPATLIEFIQQPGGVSLKLAGCEVECPGERSDTSSGTIALSAPASFIVGDTRFEIAIATRSPVQRSWHKLQCDKRDLRNPKSFVTGPSPATLSRWFMALSSLNHSAMSLQELYMQAARCAVEAIGLDGGIVLRRRDSEWEIAASHLPHPELGIHCDMTALDELLALPQTLFQGASGSQPSIEPAVVVSPLRNSAGDLVGALYGYRSVRTGNARRAIRYLEAHMVELLAGAVSQGIARIEREAEIDRRRILLEQAAETSQNQMVRETVAEQREVTLLFADLRNSTGLSAVLEPGEMYELLSQVMECLSAAVIDLDGLIIDYFGDGLAAMWNAPADQCDHPELACRAALQMLQTLPHVSRDWVDLIYHELKLGIGLHTGIAHVGNTGTHRRTKYGPRGTNVNLTSRVEAAAKQLGIQFLATEDTARRLSSRFAVRRVCRARMPGFDRPVDLFNIGSFQCDAHLSTAWKTYGDALRCFDRGELQDALDILTTIDASLSDFPARFLTEHIEQQLAGQNRRRRSDPEIEASRGIIALGAK